MIFIFCVVQYELKYIQLNRWRSVNYVTWIVDIKKITLNIRIKFSHDWKKIYKYIFIEILIIILIYQYIQLNNVHCGTKKFQNY